MQIVVGLHYFASLKPLEVSLNSRLTWSSPVALLALARQPPQHKPTFTPATSTDFSAFTGLPVKGQATCFNWPDCTICKWALAANFLLSAAKALGQLSQQN